MAAERFEAHKVTKKPFKKAQAVAKSPAARRTPSSTDVSKSTVKSAALKPTALKTGPAGRSTLKPTVAARPAVAPAKPSRAAPAKSTKSNTVTVPKAVKSAASAVVKNAPVKVAAAKAVPAKAVKTAPQKVVEKVVVKPVVAKDISKDIAKANGKAVTAHVIASPAGKVAQPLAVSRPVVSTKPGVNNGASASANIALKPQNVAGLATERSTPVIKTTKTTNGLAAKPALKLAKSLRPRPEPIPVRLPPVPVRSDSKMARNQAGITTRELEHFRDLLFQKRRELTGDVSSMENTALSTGSGSLSTLPMHMADAGTDNYEQEFTLGLVEKDRKLLRDINVALAKIQDGSYGICEGTGKPIAKPRLEAQPWAKYSIEHARALERPQFRRAF